MPPPESLVAACASMTGAAPADLGAPPSGLALSPAALVPQQQPQFPPEAVHSGEVFFMEMLAAMDQHMQQVRETQQGLVATVELACRRALGTRFGRLSLVGSAALRVETPGSDVDVVCFTRRDGPETAGLPVEALRQIHWALIQLVQQYPDDGASFSMELIDVARVPILRVLWGPPGGAVAVDVSVDQSRPVDHVRWFQRVGAAPRPSAPQPVVAPLVTLTLRCVKWWLRQRQIPRTREGGLPTLAWLLMAVHVCSLPATHEQALISSRRPMAALLGSLAAFFCHWAALGGLDGSLLFAADGSSSEFRRRTASGQPTQRGRSPWSELAVLDPTREGHESLNLVPRLPPAVQVLLTHELRSAKRRLQLVPLGNEVVYGESRHFLEEVFEPVPEGVNLLPSAVCVGMGVLLLLGEVAKGVGTVEVAILDRVVPRPGWTAPFLHRTDERSELHARLVDVEDRTGKCQVRKRNPSVVLCPCHFICRVQLERDGKRDMYWLDAEGLDRFRQMRQQLCELAQPRASKDVEPGTPKEPSGSASCAAADASNEGKASDGADEARLAMVPSPARAAAAAAARGPATTAAGGSGAAPAAPATIRI